MFDVEAYEKQRQDADLNLISQMPPIDLSPLVLSYLHYMGYSETYAALVDSSRKVERKKSIDICDENCVI